MSWLIALSSLAWLSLLLWPRRPWSTRERLEPAPESTVPDLGDVTVLVPARNEAAVLSWTLPAVGRQGRALRMILIDDQSTDSTAALAGDLAPAGLEILAGQPLPEGWTGKVWALEQGRARATTPLLLLLDADIELADGMIASLKRHLLQEKLDLVSVMAELRMESLWEKLLLPAFIYFFKLLYPFALGNSARSRLGVAAGGCVLLRSQALDQVGGFAAIRGAIIDDCALARRFKSAGHRTWIGLSHGARSRRAYPGLGGIWDMVARSAFTQLQYSLLLLLATTVAMLVLFWIPWLGLLHPGSAVGGLAVAGVMAMLGSYLPVLAYYGRNPAWACLFPVAATLYLLMTWSSAIRYWRGRRSSWKGREYGR